jgi:hypothetical protein
LGGLGWRSFGIRLASTLDAPPLPEQEGPGRLLRLWYAGFVLFNEAVTAQVTSPGLHPDG